jgi:uncharacterized protein
MDLLQRLAHARTLQRLVTIDRGERGDRGESAAPAEPIAVVPQTTTSTRVSSGSAFERRDVAIPLALAPVGPRGFAERVRDRPALLGGCLERLELPAGPRLAEDLVCLGAGQGTRAVFLDTETTGLGGVAVPFIVGLAWYESAPERLIVAQWTLSRLGGEAELLADMLGMLRKLRPEPLVSFNGASFDLPLLRIRARRHGLCDRVLDAGSAGTDHVDLLHPARRLHAGRSRDCRLSTLEQDLLGLRRRGDIDSAEIPSVFWRWVNNQSDLAAQRRLQAVCEHNLVDVVSLPALANKLAGLIRDPGDLDRARRSARHLCLRGAERQARMLLARWLEPGLEHEAPRDAGWRAAALELASLERRAGAAVQAAVLWRAAWEADPGCPNAAEAWAKQLEHGERDFDEALRVARGSRLPCERRIGRLERRVGSGAVEPGSGVVESGSGVVEPAARVAVMPLPVQPAAAQPADLANPGVPVQPAVPSSMSPGVRPSRSPASPLGRKGTSLLSVVEDHGGAKLRYRLLR